MLHLRLRDVVLESSAGVPRFCKLLKEQSAGLYTNKSTYWGKLIIQFTDEQLTDAFCEVNASHQVGTH